MSQTKKFNDWLLQLNVGRWWWWWWCLYDPYKYRSNEFWLFFAHGCNLWCVRVYQNTHTHTPWMYREFSNLDSSTFCLCFHTEQQIVILYRHRPYYIRYMVVIVFAYHKHKLNTITYKQPTNQSSHHHHYYLWKKGPRLYTNVSKENKN